ncbi:hypothetical protein LINPERHAP1_LOCUS23243 [Linum perenne]
MKLFSSSPTQPPSWKVLVVGMISNYDFLFLIMLVFRELFPFKELFQPFRLI